MARKPTLRWMRLGVAVASWVVAALLAEQALGADIGRAGQRLEQRIEMQLKGGAIPPPSPQQRERSHEESIAPWELVNV